MASDESKKKNGQNLMITVALKLGAAFFLIGGGTVQVTRLDFNNHWEFVAGQLTSIVFLLLASGYLSFSALKNLQEQKPALDAKKTAGIVLVAFSVLLALAIGVNWTQKYGMLCEDIGDAQIAVRYKHSGFDAEFSARINGKWATFGAEDLRQYGGYATENSVKMVAHDDKKKGSRHPMVFDFLTLEHIKLTERWDGKWIEDEKLIYKCRPMDLF